MKTTVELPHSYRRAKKAAALLRQKLKKLVEQGLRRVLKRLGASKPGRRSMC